MESEYETCQGNIESLLSWHESNVNEDNRNEATTRLHLIDLILFDCLGWKREDCKSEESHGNEYTDYSLFSPYRSLIVEAKKEGIYFEVPVGYSKLEYKIKSLTRDNLQIENAIKQVMDYCQSRGTALGAVCNGHQLIGFIASRHDGIPPLEGKAIVFSSLERMHKDFLKLWNYLSKPAIQDKRLERHLMGVDVSQPPPKLSASSPSYPGIKGRNMLQTDLKIVGDLVIEDVTRVREIEKEFIDECFCPSGALSQYALVSKLILENRYAALFNGKSEAPAITSATTKKKLAITKEIFAESLSKRPILLLGDVGVGKSMFIRYLIKVAGIETMKDAIALYVDLGVKASLVPDLRSFFLYEIANQLGDEYNVNIEERNFVRGVYHLALMDFSKGIYADLKKTDLKTYRKKEIKFLEDKIDNRDSFIKDCLGHISKGRKKQIVLFLDNADQRDEKIQQEAFLIAQEIAANWPVTVFFAIRPQTFHKSRKYGTLSGYHPKAFTISPPRVDEVIKKRLNFALKIAMGEQKIASLSFPLDAKFKKLEKYLNVLIYSFDVNEELIEFMDNICSGNIRQALEFITTFIGSGHVDTQKILDIEAKEEPDGHYVVPLHEFLRAIMYGDNIYYDPIGSPIANIFDLTTNDGREHFLLAILIDYINLKSSTAGKEGFVEVSEIYEYAQKAAYTPSQIEAALYRALQKNLLESEARLIPNNINQMPKLFRATTVGIYHVTRLIRSFTYVNAIIVDTPILNDEIRGEMTVSEKIGDRLLRAYIFRDYLDKQWSMVASNNVSFDWKSASEELKKDTERIYDIITSK